MSKQKLEIDEEFNPGNNFNKDGKLIAFGYFGGKFTQLDWLLPLLCDSYVYVEPFGGSMSVLLNKKNKSVIEIYNDLDSEVVNFFKVLRSDGNNLIQELSLTPYSREEFEIACTPSIVKLSNLERARRFYIRIRQGFFGINSISRGSWGYGKNSSSSNRVITWFKAIDKLPDIIERIKIVQIENKPALDVIQRYNNSDCLIYCDPPYIASQRVGGASDYNHEMDMQAHINLSLALNNSKSKVALSGYNSPLYEKLYKGWYVYHRLTRASGGKNKIEIGRLETVWTNYDPKVEGVTIQK